MPYLLDTNAVIHLLNRPQGSVAERARRHPPSAVGLSAIVVHVLYYGAFRSARSAQNTLIVDQLPLEVLEFDREDARAAGEVRAALAAQGRPIGPYDVLIAGQALARGLTLVTRNAAEFGRVDGLAIEDWES